MCWVNFMHCCPNSGLCQYIMLYLVKAHIKRLFLRLLQWITFSSKMGFGFFIQIESRRDNLNEMTQPAFWHKGLQTN